MKQFLCILSVLAVFNGFSAVKFRYTNHDKKAHIFKVKIDGKIKEITIEPEKSGSIHIEGEAKECLLITSCGDVSLKTGDHIEFVNSCVKKDKAK